MLFVFELNYLTLQRYRSRIERKSYNSISECVCYVQLFCARNLNITKSLSVMNLYSISTALSIPLPVYGEWHTQCDHRKELQKKRATIEHLHLQKDMNKELRLTVYRLIAENIIYKTIKPYAIASNKPRDAAQPQSIRINNKS